MALVQGLKQIFANAKFCIEGKLKKNTDFQQKALNFTTRQKINEI
jgi:hypothetical protein